MRAFALIFFIALQGRLWPGADGCQRPNFSLYHSFNNLSRDFAKKVAQIIFPDFDVFALDF
jgi:hypothetical protein